jgi:hypothetical protein
MTSSLLRSSIVAALAIGFLLSARIGDPAQAPGFSDASLNGNYVFRTSGSSLFSSPDQLTSIPVFLAAIGRFRFDGHGVMRGGLTVSATRTDVVPVGKYNSPYSSQIRCEAEMTGTYSLKPDGTGTMQISFTPTKAGAACGASTGVFDFALVSPTVGEIVSSGQLMADPSKGEFNAYVVQGEFVKQRGSGRP